MRFLYISVFCVVPLAVSIYPYLLGVVSRVNKQSVLAHLPWFVVFSFIFFSHVTAILCNKNMHFPSNVIQKRMTIVLSLFFFLLHISCFSCILFIFQLSSELTLTPKCQNHHTLTFGCKIKENINKNPWQNVKVIFRKNLNYNSSIPCLTSKKKIYQTFLLAITI